MKSMRNIISVIARPRDVENLKILDDTRIGVLGYHRYLVDLKTDDILPKEPERMFYVVGRKMSRDEEIGIRDLIYGHVEYKTGVKCSNVVIDYNEDSTITLFYPMIDNTWIHVDNIERKWLDLNVNHYIGMQYLTHSLVAWAVKPFPGMIQVGDAVCYLIKELKSLTKSELKDKIYHFISSIRNSIRQGVTVISAHEYNEITRLSENWNIKKEDVYVTHVTLDDNSELIYTEVPYVILTSDEISGCTISKWVHDSIYRTPLIHLPSYNIIPGSKKLPGGSLVVSANSIKELEDMIQ